MKRDVASVATMILAACADDDPSDVEVGRLREVIAKNGIATGDVDALIEAAQDEVGAIMHAAGNEAALQKALKGVGEAIGDVAARQKVLELAVEVAAADGLNDDENTGIDALATVFGVDGSKLRGR